MSRDWVACRKCVHTHMSKSCEPDKPSSLVDVCLRIDQLHDHLSMELINANANMNHNDNVSHIGCRVLNEQRLSSTRMLTALEPGVRYLERVLAAPVTPVPYNHQPTQRGHTVIYHAEQEQHPSFVSALEQVVRSWVIGGRDVQM